QKQRTNQAHVAYESRNWSFGSATGALAMVNPNQDRNRHYELYNTRAQYSRPGSRPAARPLPRHSSNPAYDVYDTRGWYIGSDPDPTGPFMISIDPAPLGQTVAPANVVTCASCCRRCCPASPLHRVGREACPC